MHWCDAKERACSTGLLRSEVAILVLLARLAPARFIASELSFGLLSSRGRRQGTGEPAFHDNHVRLPPRQVAFALSHSGFPNLEVPLLTVELLLSPGDG